MFRSNRKRILFTVLAIVGVVLTLNISNALAEPICDTHTGSPCCESGCFEWIGEPGGDWDHIDETWENPWQYVEWGGFICLDECPPDPEEGPLVELTEMGGFDAAGDWQWDPTFEAEFDAWAGPDWNWRELFTPYKTEPTVTDSRMDFKHFADAPNHVRVAVMMSASGVMIPSIRRSTSSGAFFVDLVEPPGCVGDEDGNIPGAQECVDICAEDSDCNPANYWVDTDDNGWDGGDFTPDYTKTHPNSCCWFWDTPQFRLVDEVPFAEDRFVEMLWVNKNISTPLDIVDRSCMYGVNYNNDRTVQEWHSSGWEECFVDNYFMFTEGIDPELGTNTFILKYDGTKTIELNYEVINNGPMPVVPAQYVQAVTMTAGKSGKQVTTGQTVTVDNITARIINGALVVQWAEPDLALFPDPLAGRKELMCAIGTPHSTVTGTTWQGHMLWIRSPFQIGSIVVPPDQYTFIKNKVLGDGGNTIEIEFQYRYKYPPTQEGFWTYQNRGYSESIFLNLE
jgi:hypothetical protein